MIFGQRNIDSYQGDYPKPNCNDFTNLVQSVLIEALKHYQGEDFINRIEAILINRVAKKSRKQLLQVKIFVDKNAYSQYIECNRSLEEILQEKINDIEIHIMGD